MSEQRSESEATLTDGVLPPILGVAYLLVGVGLFASLAIGSITLIAAVLVGILGVIFVSLALVVYQEGLVTPENKIIAIFVLLAMGLLFGLSEFTELPSEVVFGAVFLVGVLVPHLLIEYTGVGTTAE